MSRAFIFVFVYAANALWLTIIGYRLNGVQYAWFGVACLAGLSIVDLYWPRHGRRKGS